MAESPNYHLDCSDTRTELLSDYMLSIFVYLLQGFLEACERGFITGHKVAGVRFVLEDGK